MNNEISLARILHTEGRVVHYMVDSKCTLQRPLVQQPLQTQVQSTSEEKSPSENLYCVKYSYTDGCVARRL